jgi:hypothetical protein
MSSFYYPDSPPKIVMEVLESNFESLGRKVADAPVLCGPSIVGIHISFTQNL